MNHEVLERYDNAVNEVAEAKQRLESARYTVECLESQLKTLKIIEERSKQICVDYLAQFNEDNND